MSNESDHLKNQFLLTEYSALREEIIKRVELEYQLINLSLVTFGVICGLSFQPQSSLIILLYPLLAAFIVAGWVNSDNSVQCIAKYIKSQIEVKLGDGNTNWEHYIENQISNGLSALSVGGTFLGTSLFAIIVGIYLAHFDTTKILLLIVSGVSLIFSSVLLLWYFSRRRSSARIPVNQG